MHCMTHIFKNEYSKDAVDVVPLLLKCIEKCSQSSQVCNIQLFRIIIFIIMFTLCSLECVHISII